MDNKRPNNYVVVSEMLANSLYFLTVYGHDYGRLYRSKKLRPPDFGSLNKFIYRD